MKYSSIPSSLPETVYSRRRDNNPYHGFIRHWVSSLHSGWRPGFYILAAQCLVVSPQRRGEHNRGLLWKTGNSEEKGCHAWESSGYSASRSWVTFYGAKFQKGAPFTPLHPCSSNNTFRSKWDHFKYSKLYVNFITTEIILLCNISCFTITFGDLFPTGEGTTCLRRSALYRNGIVSSSFKESSFR